jgi:cobyrinic acid a,c-diamide synthase
VDIPRILIAGMRGGSGKTVVATSLAAAMRKRGKVVAPFKKGPDYIDAAWLTEAGGNPCRNLDLFFMNRIVLNGSFLFGAKEADVAVIEGNRGLYDGMDAKGSYSTAELAKHLGAPVVLTVDCTKSTGTVAAVVLGCQKLDPKVPLKGVVLNQVRAKRHEAVLREAVTTMTGLPVLGVIPRIPKRMFPERHLGLVPPEEHGAVSQVLDQMVEVVAGHLDLDAMWKLAEEAPPLERSGVEVAAGAPPSDGEPVRIGVVRDAAFTFYYPENLEALENEGATIVEVSSLSDETLPEMDGLYIGGGFPETAAQWLASNESFRESLRMGAEGGLPIYAECGGAVYLGKKLIMEGGEYPMAGVFPAVFAFDRRPQGHGYTLLEALEDNPYFKAGETLRGHEFHYTYIQDPDDAGLEFAFHVHRGHGINGRKDGMRVGKVLASYTHIHALGVPTWAPSFVAAAREFKKRSAKSQ